MKDAIEIVDAIEATIQRYENQLVYDDSANRDQLIGAIRFGHELLAAIQPEIDYGRDFGIIDPVMPHEEPIPEELARLRGMPGHRPEAY